MKTDRLMALLQPALLHGKLFQWSQERILYGPYRHKRLKANELDLHIKLMRMASSSGSNATAARRITRAKRLLVFEFFHYAATIVQHSRNVLLNLMMDFARRYAWKRIVARVSLLKRPFFRIST